MHHYPNRLLAALALAVTSVAVAACGGGEPITAPADTADATTNGEQAASPTPEATAPTVNVTKAQSPLGEILVGDDGLTLYGFTNDLDGRSACNGTCAEAWPPVIVGPDWDVAPDLDAGIFNTVARDDGQLQLVAGKWPLYYFGGDAKAGDLNGQGSGDVWFVVGTDGILIEDAVDGAEAETDESGETASAGASDTPVTVGSTSAGEVLVDQDGLSLYGFLNDEDGEPTCFDACADAWPPVLVDSAELPAGLDPEVFSVVAYGDDFQLKAGVWPLYRFAGDGAAGDINGQESGDVWFLARPDGGLIRPEGEASSAEPAADEPAKDEPAEDDGYGY
jgi:predicted lipoprotein with Yx(FWY)xxD motif